MIYARIAYKFIQGLLITAVLSVVALLILGHFGYINTVKSYVVQSGSMEPAVKTASIIFSLPQKSYKQGEIITFNPNGNTKQTVTHRIEFKMYPDGVNEAPLFITAGDANKDVDKWEVRQEHIIGKAVLTVPYIGYLVDFAKKPHGFILLVIVPATIVIYEELKALFLEIIKGTKKLKGRYFKGLAFKGSRTIDKDISDKKRKFSSPKAWAIIPLIGAGVFMVSFSAGYFSDIELSLGNIFQAGTWNAPPENGPSPSVTPTPMVISGNPNCNQAGYGFGFKIEPAANGTYPLVNDPPRELTGGAPSDPDNSITISGVGFKDDEPSEPISFNWSASLGIDAVLVKSATSANLYTYNPESFGDSGLVSTTVPGPSGNTAGISHIEFCYDYD